MAALQGAPRPTGVGDDLPRGHSLGDGRTAARSRTARSAWRSRPGYRSCRSPSTAPARRCASTTGASAARRPRCACSNRSRRPGSALDDVGALRERVRDPHPGRARRDARRPRQLTSEPNRHPHRSRLTPSPEMSGTERRCWLGASVSRHRRGLSGRASPTLLRRRASTSWARSRASSFISSAAHVGLARGRTHVEQLGDLGVRVAAGDERRAPRVPGSVSTSSEVAGALGTGPRSWNSSIKRRVMLGASNASPAATTRTASSSVIGSGVLQQEPARAGAQRRRRRTRRDRTS